MSSPPIAANSTDVTEIAFGLTPDRPSLALSDFAQTDDRAAIGRRAVSSCSDIGTPSQR